MRNYLLKIVYLMAALGFSGASGAVDFQVNDFGDAGDSNLDDGVCATVGQKCTLRAAVEQARKIPGARIVLPDGLYELSSGKDIRISSNLTIEGGGPDKVVVSGKNLSRVFSVVNGASVTISGITIADGKAYNGGGIAVLRAKLALVNSIISKNRSDKHGAGLYISLGMASIDDSVISGNEADGPGGAVYITGKDSWLALYGSRLENNISTSGGGIYCDISGRVHLEKATFKGNRSTGVNTADGGGAIYNRQCTVSLSQVEFGENSAGKRGGALFNAAKGEFTIGRSSFSGNTAKGDGGAIYSDGSLEMQRVYLLKNSGAYGSALYDAGESRVVLVTAADNRSGKDGGAIYHNSSGAMTLKYSTIAKNDGGNIVNEAGSLEADSSLIADAVNGSDCVGGITSAGYNLDSDGSCSLTGTGDKSSVNPLLIATQDVNGYEPGSGSPAIDSGSTDCPILDQRFHTRSGQCDIGAFEAGGAIAQAGTISFKQPARMAREDDGVVTVTLTRSMGSDGNVSVRYQDDPMGTARSNFDFDDFDGVLEWSDGQSGDKTFQIRIIPDGIPNERIESIKMFLSDSRGGADIGAIRTAVLDIVDAGAQFGELAFESGSYIVSESDGSLSVTVKRSNGDVGRVSVKYATSDKKATAGQDYQAVSGTLVFADRETEKSVVIPIIDNNSKDGNRTFTIELSDITGGAEPGRFSSATVTISDDESGDDGVTSGGGAGTTNGTSSASSGGGGGGGSPGVVLLLALSGILLGRTVKRM